MGSSFGRVFQNTYKDRLDFVIRSYTAKAAIANKNMSVRNVVLIHRKDFLEMGGFQKFEECLSIQVQARELTSRCRVLFISHRWQANEKNQPDSDDHIQYRVAKRFLETHPTGQAMTHIWVDYSCIDQDRDTLEGREAFLIRLDNIPTSIFLSHTVLVVPRLETSGEENYSYYSDLQEINGRGWCLLEAVTALAGGSRIFVSFTAGNIDDTWFVEVEGGLPANQPLSLARLRSQSHRARPPNLHQGVSSRGYPLRSYTPAVNSAVAALANKKGILSGTFSAIVEANWRAAQDPAAVLAEARSLVSNAKLKDLLNSFELLMQGLASYPPIFSVRASTFLQQEAAALTTNTKEVEGDTKLDFSHGRKIAGLLPNFTAEVDRDVVTQIMTNVVVYVETGFKSVEARSTGQIQWLLFWFYGRSAFSVMKNAGATVYVDTNALPADDLETRRTAEQKTQCSSCVHSWGSWQQQHPFVTLFVLYTRVCGLAVQLLFLFYAVTQRKNARNTVVQHVALEWMGLLPCDLRLLVKQLARISRSSKTEGKPLSLRLCGNFLGPEGAKALTLVHHEVRLVKLDLVRCRLGDNGARVLGKWLEESNSSAQHLAELKLAKNFIGPAGAEPIAQGLKKHSSLLYLCLSMNPIGPDGARSIAEMLKENTSLKVLYMVGNFCGSEGACAIAEGLKGNGFLKKLSFGKNNICEEGVQAFIRCFAEANSTLSELSLYEPGRLLCGALRDELKKAWEASRRDVSSPSEKAFRGLTLLDGVPLALRCCFHEESAARYLSFFGCCIGWCFLCVVVPCDMWAMYIVEGEMDSLSDDMTTDEILDHISSMWSSFTSTTFFRVMLAVDLVFLVVFCCFYTPMDLRLRTHMKAISSGMENNKFYS